MYKKYFYYNIGSFWCNLYVLLILFILLKYKFIISCASGEKLYFLSILCIMSIKCKTETSLTCGVLCACFISLLLYLINGDALINDLQNILILF
jgi:hypothetical protein